MKDILFSELGLNQTVGEIHGPLAKGSSDLMITFKGESTRANNTLGQINFCRGRFAKIRSEIT